VVVTLNYRLGSLGFLALGDEGARFGAVENRGLLDQIAALTWVRDNIEAFGGNPEDVTVFGESAGATSVSLLLATPSAKGLFKRSIMQSSTAPLELPSADGYAEARAIMLRALSIAPGALEKLNHVPVALLSSAQAKVESQLRFPHFFPVLDRALFPAQPGDLHAAGEGSDVPVILGWNRDEFNLFALANLNEWSLPLPDETLFADAALRVRPDQRAATATLLAAYRDNRRKLGLPHDNRAILRAIDGDRAFRIPSLRLADALRAKGGAVYAYHFTYGSPALGGALGACHALELPFVFGTHDTPEQARFVGKGEAVTTLSQRVMALWTSFARTGEPVSEGVPAWPTHAPDRFATLELDVAPRIVDDPFGEERRAWEGLF
jgi:para-nitrobenzyl esterase